MSRIEKLSEKLVADRRSAAHTWIGFWISPDGGILDTGDLEHYQFVRKNPEIFGFEKGELEQYSAYSEGAALDKGWARVRIYRTSATWESRRITQKFVDSLNYFALQNVVTDWNINLRDLRKTIDCSNQDLKVASTPNDVLKLGRVSAGSRSAALGTYVEQKVDPALLTYPEFWERVNPRGKGHPESAYDWPISKMNGTREKYPNLLFRRNINGITFEFRMEKKDRHQYKYVRSDADGNHVRINGELQYYTVEELEKLVPSRYQYSFSVFDGEKQVAVAQDEWGCLLVSVAREYRNFGLGPVLTKMAWEAEPGKSTGGCTPGGAAVVRKVHREFVREYLRKGFYSYLVREGALTKERVQEIIKSASLSVKTSEGPYQGVNLNANDPKDFLLYGDNGAFILYDRKLKDIFDKGDEDRNSFWYDRFIKGTSFAGSGYHGGEKLYLHQLGGDTQQIKKFMFELALSYCKREGFTLHVYDEDLGVAKSPGVDLQGNIAILKGAPIEYSGMVMQERRFRKSFDQYGEFHSRLVELAEAKYR